MIKYYEKIEKEGRGAKEKTRQKFEISTISSLNVILHHSEEIIRLYESNQSSSSRIRMSQSRFPHVDQHLYQSFSFLRSKNIEVSGLDFMIKASEIKEKLLSSANLSVEDRLKLEKFNFTSGFIRGFKNRHNIRLKNLSGEAGSVKEETFEDEGLPICADENISASEIEETENIIIEDEEICDPYSNISFRDALESFYKLKGFLISLLLSIYLMF